MRVTVLGAGSWGTTVASILTRRDHESLIWARSPATADEINAKHSNERYLAGFPLPGRLRATADLAEAAAHAELLVVGVPTGAFRATLEQVRPDLHPWIPVVSLSKGLERDSLLRMTEVIKQVLPGHPAAALTGPNLAKEIMAGMAAATVIATEDLTVATALQEVFRRGLLRVYTNHDVIGCEVGGALKNVIAIAAGVVEGTGLGHNAMAALITRGLVEISRLATAEGGRRETLAGLSGLGDLVLTCTGDLSRNRRVGIELGRGRAVPDVLAGIHMVAEGVRTTGAALALGERHGIELPITAQMAAVLDGRKTPREAVEALMIRPQKQELEAR